MCMCPARQTIAYLPNNPVSEKTLGKFTAGCARRPPIPVPSTRLAPLQPVTSVGQREELIDAAKNLFLKLSNSYNLH